MKMTLLGWSSGSLYVILVLVKLPSVLTNSSPHFSYKETVYIAEYANQLYLIVNEQRSVPIRLLAFNSLVLDEQRK